MCVNSFAAAVSIFRLLIFSRRAVQNKSTPSLCFRALPTLCGEYFAVSAALILCFHIKICIVTRRTKREIWTHIYEQVLQKNALSILFVSLITRPLFFFVVTVCFTSLFLRCYTVHFLHSPLFLKFHFIFFLCLSLYSHTSRKFVMIYRVISLRSVHLLCSFFFAYKLDRL